MAKRRRGGILRGLAVLALAGLATAAWAASDDSARPDTPAAATQQSTDPGAAEGRDQGRAADDQRPLGRGRGGFDRRLGGPGFGPGFGRGGFNDGPRSWRRHWHHHWQRGRGRGPEWRRGGWGAEGAGGGRFGRPGMRRGPAMGALLLDGPMLGAFRRLNLSDAQRARMRTILGNARNGAAQERGNQARGAAARPDLGAILNPGDPNYARAVQAAKDRAVDRIQRATQTQQALYNVLTSAQKAQLSQMFAQQRSRMQQRAAQLRARRAQRGGGGPAGPGAQAQPDAQGQPGAPADGGGQ